MAHRSEALSASCSIASNWVAVEKNRKRPLRRSSSTPDRQLRNQLQRDEAFDRTVHLFQEHPSILHRWVFFRVTTSRQRKQTNPHRIYFLRDVGSFTFICDETHDYRCDKLH
mmetsp:Transcript_52725/g.83681  ORF Transcript_52725/g.83681 Transcript_52725/m.83681 type:complete len:112 (-) Transcript_52725:27-362(-)